MNAAAADQGGLVAMLKGEENLFLYELETHPRNNAYAFSGDPATLTVTASAEALAKVRNASLVLTLPNGETTELGSISGGSTAASFFTNMPLTFTVKGDTVVLSKEFSFADGDKVWNLDDELAEAVTLTVHNAFADADMVKLTAGGNGYTLPAAGGSAVIVPGAYDVTAKIVKLDDSGTEGSFFEVNFGRLSLTENRTLSVGDSVKAELTLAKDTIVQNEDIPVSFGLSDSEGNVISDIGGMYLLDDEYETGYSRIRNYSLNINRWKSDGDTWEDLDSEFLEWKRQDGVFAATVPTSRLDNEVGVYRVRLSSYESWPITFGDDDWRSFSVTVEETRPSARVNLKFRNFNGYEESGAAYYVLLKDNNGQWISRRAMTPANYWNEDCYTYLPIGGKYRAAMITSCYNQTLGGYAAVVGAFEIDLTDKAAGDVVDIAVQAEDSWPITRFTDSAASDGESGSQPIAQPVDQSDLPDSGQNDQASETQAMDYMIDGVTVYPFAELPEAGVSLDTHMSVDGIASDGIGETDVDCVMRVYEDYYMTDVAVRIHHDLSAGGSLALGLPMAPTLTCDKEEYYFGSDVTLNYRLFDLCGNAVRDIQYSMESKYDEEMPDMGRKDSSAVLLGTSAYVTVHRANGSVTGQYPLSDVYQGSVTLTGLADGSYTAAATVQGNLIGKTGESVTFTVGGEAPPEPEKTVEMPANLIAKAQSVSVIALSWDAPTQAVEKYILYRDGKPFAEVNGDQTSYTDEDITADRYYVYTLYAVGSEGITSEGATADSRPSERPDTQAPTAPTGLQTKLNGSEVVLTWNRSTDNVAVTNYIVTCNGEEIGRTYNRRFTQSGLMPGTGCTYTVSAIDGAGNRSSESEPASVVLPDTTAIASATPGYSRNKLGYMIGTGLTMTAKATADIQSIRMTAYVLMADGSEDSREVTLTAGKNGAFVGSLTLPADFMTITQVTLEGFRSGSQEPAVTKNTLTEPINRAGRFTVSLTNADNLTLPSLTDEVTVTIKGYHDKYSVTRTVEHFSGSIFCFPPDAQDYSLTLTASDGQLLYSADKIAVSSGGQVTVDAEELPRFLRVKLTGLPRKVTDYAGFEVGLYGNSFWYSGTSRADGYVVWRNGSDTLALPADVCIRKEINGVSTPVVTLLRYDHYFTASDDVYEIQDFSADIPLTGLVTDVTHTLTTVVTQSRMLTAHVQDKRGNAVEGLAVDFSAKSHTKAVTGADGNASAAVALIPYSYFDGVSYYNASVSVGEQTAPDGRIWVGDETQYTTDDCTVTVTAMSDDIRIRSVVKTYRDGEIVPLTAAELAGASLKMTAYIGTASYHDYEQYTFLQGSDGDWRASGLSLKDGASLWVTVSATLDGKEWHDSFQAPFTVDNPVYSEDIVLHEDSSYKFSLVSSDKGILPGGSRRFIVFDQAGTKIKDIVTAASFTVLTLPTTEEYYHVVATFDTESECTYHQWVSNFGPYTDSVTFRPNENRRDYSFTATYGASFDELFWRENGFSGGGSRQYRLGDGNWRVDFGYTVWSAVGSRSKTDYIILPKGAYDVSESHVAAYDEETHTIVISGGFIEHFSFCISAADLKADPHLRSWFECDFGSEHYTSALRSVSLSDSGIRVAGDRSVYLEDLKKDSGYEINGTSQLYGGDVTLAVYDDDTLLRYQCLASSAIHVDMPLTKRIGEHTVRVVVTKGSIVDTAEWTVDVKSDDRPMVISATANVNNGGGPIAGKGTEKFNGLYQHKLIDSLYVTATVRKPERIKKIWAVVSLGSHKMTVSMNKDKDNPQLYTGKTMVSSENMTVSNVEIRYEEVDNSETTGQIDEVVGALDFDDETVNDFYTVEHTEESDDTLVDATDPKQKQALKDWETYAQLLRDADSMTYEQLTRKLADLYGDDNEWTLPMAEDANGVQYSMTYVKDSDRAADFLNSSKAATVDVEGEKRKYGIEFEADDQQISIYIHGLNDLFYFPSPEPDTVSADKLLVKDLWKLNGKGFNGFILQRILNPKASVIYQKELRAAMKERQAAEKILNNSRASVVFNLSLFGTTELIGEYYDTDPYIPREYDDDSGTSDDPCAEQPSHLDEQLAEIDNRYNAGYEALDDTVSLIGFALGFMPVAEGTITSALAMGSAKQLFNIYSGREKMFAELNERLYYDSGIYTREDENPCDRAQRARRNGYQVAGSGDFTALVDPSGTIFEAAADEPVEGVTATVYYKDSSGRWVLWDSEAYDQNPNPMRSLENGYYGWDVLTGKWKVVFGKDGYFLAESVELDVPPEHTDVNISLVASSAPAVTGFTAKADGGSVTITFDKYMRTEDILRDGAVTVTFGDTVPDGKLTAVNAKISAKGNKQAASVSNIAGGDEVAKQFVYTFDDPLPKGATVNVTVSDEAAAYNGMTLTESYQGAATVPDSDPAQYATGMQFEDVTLLEKNVGETFSIGRLTFDGEKPGAVIYESGDTGIATVDASGKVTAVGEGYVTIWARCDTLETGRPVYVTRVSVTPDADDNAVKFCRENNLVVHKGCWMWSSAAGFNLENPIEGDGKYLAVSWRILENGSEKAGATLEEGVTAVAVKEYYTPTQTGTLTGEITYQYYTYHNGVWTKADGKTYTAAKEMAVVTVTGLSVNTPPASVSVGDTLDLDKLVLNVHTSDGLVSEVPYANFGRWGMTLSTEHGAVLTKSDRVLTVTHPDSGCTVAVNLWTLNGHGITVTNDGHGSASASVEKADPGDVIILTAAPNNHYRFKEWQVVKGSVTVENNRFTMPDTDVSVKAVFESEHHLTHTAALSAACETDGHIEYWTCEVCGKIFADAHAATEITEAQTVIAKTGHDWDNGVVTTEPTCTEKGVKTFTCLNDPNHTKTESVSALGHDLKLVPAVAPTCEADGRKAYYECETCGRLYEDGKAAMELTDRESVVIPAMGHDYGKWIVTKPATETNEGVETRICQHDPSHTETRVIPAKDKGEEITYLFGYGVHLKWTKGSRDAARFTVKRSEHDELTFPNFLGIEVDGAPVSRDNYTATQGSVNIELKTAYLERLTEGRHSLTMLFTDGSAETTFTVMPKPKAQKPSVISHSPRTGDETNVLWFAMAVGSFAAMIGVLCTRRKKHMR